MNHKELVNKVLIRLRERPLGATESISSNSYAALISSLVNEAKQVVEDSWDWSGLRETISGTTIPGVFSYELEGAGDRFKMLDALNDTSNQFLHLIPSSTMTDYYLNNDDVPEGEPYYYSYSGTTDEGFLQIDVYPLPDDEYTMRFNGILRTGDLVDDTDTLRVPTQPVFLLAYAYAVDERGEDMGQASAYAHQRAKSSLSDAIALDAARYPDEITWSTC